MKPWQRDYDIIDVIGRGGGGIVLRVYSKNKKKQFAAKFSF